MAKKKVFSIGSALAQGLEETIESAQNYSSELRVDVLPISKVETDPDNPRDLALRFADVRHGVDPSDPEYVRKKEELASLETLANSIKSQGIINPITVYKFGENYRLIAGERRTLASILAGKNDIQARILDDKPDDLRISLLQWIENIERADLSLWERLLNLGKILSAYAEANSRSVKDITVTEISDLLGCSKPHAMNYKAALHADDEIKQLILDNQIKNLEKAALLSDIKSKEVRAGAIHACLSGASLKQLKAYTRQAIVKPSVAKPVEKRGRQPSMIHLGATENIDVARIILNSILSHDTMSHLAHEFENVDWMSYRSVSEVFKKLLKKLEELHA